MIIRKLAVKFIYHQGVLYKRTLDGMQLHCLDENKARKVMMDVHEGVYDKHMNSTMLVRMIKALTSWRWSTQTCSLRFEMRGISCPRLTLWCVRWADTDFWCAALPAAWPASTGSSKMSSSRSNIRLGLVSPKISSYPCIGLDLKWRNLKSRENLREERERKSEEWKKK